MGTKGSAAGVLSQCIPLMQYSLGFAGGINLSRALVSNPTFKNIDVDTNTERVHEIF